MKSILEILTSNQNVKKPAVIFYDEYQEVCRLSYADLLTGGLRVAQALKNLKKNTILISLPTGPDFLYSFFGSLLAGAIPVPLPVADLMKKADFGEHLKKVSERTGSFTFITSNQTKKCLLPDFSAAGASSNLKFIVPEDWIEKPLLPLKDVYPVDEESICLIQFSSGSTQEPRGVELTNRNLLTNLEQMKIGMAVTSQDVLASWLPLYHDMGLIGGCLAPLYNQVTAHLMNPLDFLASPSSWMKLLSDQKVSVILGPDFYYRTCALKVSQSQKASLDLSCVRLALSGAEPVSAKTCREFLESYANAGLKPSALFPVYGLAEGTLGVSFPNLKESFQTERIFLDGLENGEAIAVDEISSNRLKEDSSRQSVELVSCGYPLSQTEIKIVDNQYDEVGERHVGKILIKTPSMTRGYHQDPARSAELFYKGWLKTGDLGYLARGRLFILGREKDLIKINGKSYHPADLERKVTEVQGFRMGRSAAVSYFDFNTQMEIPAMVIESQEFWPWRRRALKRAVKNKVSELITLTENRVAIVPPCTLTRTTSGKVKRFELRNQLAMGQIQKVERRYFTYWFFSKIELNRLAFKIIGHRLQTKISKLFSNFGRQRDELESQLVTLFSSVTQVKRDEIDLKTPFEKFNLDSLKIAELTGRLSQQWGPVPITKFLEFKNLGDVRDFLANHLDRKVAEINRQTQANKFNIDEIKWGSAIDENKFWSPPSMSPLSYLPSYALLSQQQQRRYNQLFALSICEQFIWFESQLLCLALRNLLKKTSSPVFSEALVNIIAEEEKHSEMFWRLLQSADSKLYPRRNFAFFNLRSVQTLLIKALVQFPGQFLVWIWMAIFFEERTLDYSRQYLRFDKENPGQLEPLFSEVHKFHLKDEVRHLQMDGHFLELAYNGAPAWKRKISGQMMRKIMKSYVSPRRTSLKILKTLGREFPDLRESVIPALIKELPTLRTSKDFHQMAFSMKSVGRSLHLMSHYDELDEVWDLFMVATKEEAQKYRPGRHSVRERAAEHGQFSSDAADQQAIDL